MNEPLFIAQTTLETWVEKGEARFEDNRLTLLKKNQSYEMMPAVRFHTVLDGEDVNGWLGSVKTLPQLLGTGAEHFHDSVISGDTAYQCDVGFVGHLEVSKQPPSPAIATTPPPLPTATKPPSTVPNAENSKEEDMRLLTEFMLKNM